MIRKLLFTTIVLFVLNTLHAQVIENRVKLDTSIHPSFYFETDLSEDMVKDALEAYFKTKSVEKEKGKGFIIKKGMPYELYKRAKVDSFENEFLDFYFTVDTKKQKGPDVTAVHVSASQGYNNFISREQQADSWEGLRKFSEFLRTSYLEKYRLQVQIDDLNKEITKSKTKLGELEAAVAALTVSIADKNSKLTSLKEQLDKIK